jgi:hypothetical protein
LTGNAGTGKTAAAQAFCEANQSKLPANDGLYEIAASRFVVKDLSGIPDEAGRISVLEEALRLSVGAKVLVCANEGILRNALRSDRLNASPVPLVLEDALRRGASKEHGLCVINVNRQRPTADAIWEPLLSYVDRKENWESCKACPAENLGCPILTNASALRKPAVRAALKLLVRYASGRTVPTLRDVLGLLSWSITGDPESQSSARCKVIRQRFRDIGSNDAYDSRHAYYSLVFGYGLPFEAIERSPLLGAIRATGLGEISDLSVDEWLRDPHTAPQSARDLTTGALPLSRFRTSIGTMSFETLGETLSTSEDPVRVEACVDALSDKQHSALTSWRRHVFFEAPDAVGGLERACSRLLGIPFFPDLLATAQNCAAALTNQRDLQVIVRGLNMLVTGFPAVGEGLIVPDSSSLFSRDPGAFRPAKPSVVHSQVPLNRLELSVPDTGLVEEVLDVDHVEVELSVRDQPEARLRIGPEIYQAIRQAEVFGGPVGRSFAEMAEIRDFYGRISVLPDGSDTIRIADPAREALAPIRLPVL